MRCVFLSPHFASSPGAVGDHVFYLTRALPDHGIEPIVVTSRDSRIGAPPPGVVLHSVVERWDAANAGRLADIVRDLHPDAVNVQYSPYLYHRYGVPLWLPHLARTARLRWTTTFHEVAVRLQLRRPKSWPLAILQRRVARRLAAASSAVVFTIPYYHRLLRSASPRAHVIPVGSNVPPVPVSEDALARLRERLAGPDEFLVASFGAEVAWRRSDLLLRAIRRARGASGRSFKVLLLGDQGDHTSPGRARLDRLVADLDLAASVHVTGRLPAGEVFAHLRAADLFALLDSDAYGGASTKSTSLVAAFGAGLPILGNRGRLTDPLLRHEENIHLVDSLDVDVIARALIELASDSGLRRRLAEGSRETYRRDLAWEVIAERYAVVLRGVLSS